MADLHSEYLEEANKILDEAFKKIDSLGGPNMEFGIQLSYDFSSARRTKNGKEIPVNERTHFVGRHISRDMLKPYFIQQVGFEV